MTNFIPGNTLSVQEASDQTDVPVDFILKLAEDLQIFYLDGHVSTAAVPIIEQLYRDELAHDTNEVDRFREELND